MGVLFFKNLEYVYRDLKAEKKELEELGLTPEGSMDLTLVTLKADLLKDVLVFVKGYSWLVKGPAKDRLKLLLQSNYNYEMIANQIGTTRQALKVSVNYASNKLYHLFGKDFFDKIRSCDQNGVADLRSLFYAVTGRATLKTIYPEGVLEVLPSPSLRSDISMVDCGAEIDFIASLSIENIRRKMEALDTDKLKHVLYVTNTDNAVFARVNRALQALLRGDIENAEELFSWVGNTLYKDHL